MAEEEVAEEVVELIFSTFSRMFQLFSTDLAGEVCTPIQLVAFPLREGQLASGHDTYWFRTGLERYYAWRESISRGWVEEEKALAVFADHITRYLGDAHAGKLSLHRAGLFKQDRRDLLEGGGFLTVLALDLELRRDGQTSLDELVENLFHEYEGAHYSAEDVRVLAQHLAGTDLRSFFSRYVEGTDFLPLEQMLAETGLIADWDLASSAVQLRRLPQDAEHTLFHALSP